MHISSEPYEVCMIKLWRSKGAEDVIEFSMDKHLFMISITFNVFIIDSNLSVSSSDCVID